MRKTILHADLKLPKKKMFNKENNEPANKTGRKHFMDQTQSTFKQTDLNEARKTMMLFPQKKNVTNYENTIERKPSIRVFQPQNQTNFKLTDKSSQISILKPNFQPTRSSSANIYSIFNNDGISNRKKF